jgi:hypothetical protein
VIILGLCISLIIASRYMCAKDVIKEFMKRMSTINTDVRVKFVPLCVLDFQAFQSSVRW